MKRRTVGFVSFRLAAEEKQPTDEDGYKGRNLARR